MFTRPMLSKRSSKAFQDIFNAHNKPQFRHSYSLFSIASICFATLHCRHINGKNMYTIISMFRDEPSRQLRYGLIFLFFCAFVSLIIYQIYAISIKAPSTPFLSSSQPTWKSPSSALKPPKSANDDRTSSLSVAVLDQLKRDKARPSELETKIVPPHEVDPELISYTQLSWEEECESASFQPPNYYNYLLKEDQIEYIFPSNDEDLYRTLHSEEFWHHWDTSFLNDEYWQFVRALDPESEKDVKELRSRYDKKHRRQMSAQQHSDDHSRNNGSARNMLAHQFRSSISKKSLFDWNGLTSDLSLKSKRVESVGQNGEYWYTSDDCIHRKSCDVYPPHRVLSKSKVISCDEIMQELMPPIYECVAKYGKKCKNIIDSGYYRIIMKTVRAETGEPVVIKMMKSKSIKKERDVIRHLREAILLGYLYDMEQEWKQNNNDRLFTQTLNNGQTQKQRGFNYVEEYGHCVTPLWISVSPLYKIPLDKWIQSGFAARSPLKKLIFMSLQIAYSVELIHTIPAGPFHHTDIQPRQFLLDEDDNFNRGKFQPFHFDDETGKIEKCWYCGHRSRGHWRAPEEPKKRPLNEKLDIFSMGLTIWALYSNEVPFEEADFDELEYLYYDLRRIPPMTPNTPPAIKDVIRMCLSWDPRKRPTATQVVRMLQDIYYLNLEVVTEGFQDYTSERLMEAEAWSDSNDPPKERRGKLPNQHAHDGDSV